jgi:hypothetical protein
MTKPFLPAEILRDAFHGALGAVEGVVRDLEMPAVVQAQFKEALIFAFALRQREQAGTASPEDLEILRRTRPLPAFVEAHAAIDEEGGD